MGHSLEIGRRTGAVGMALKRILLILLILRAKARLSGAFKTSTESLSIIGACFLNDSKVDQAITGVV